MEERSPESRPNAGLEFSDARPVRPWALGCSVGCFVLALVGAGLFLLGGGFYVGELSDAGDPEVQWPLVGRYLPHERRPPELSPERLLQLAEPGSGGWLLAASGQRYLALVLCPLDRAQRRRLFESGSGLRRLGLGGGWDFEPGELSLGGRARPCLRYRSQGAAESFFGVSFAPADGPSLLLDLSRGSQGIFLRMTRSTRLDEPIADDELLELLAPFDFSDL